MLISRLATLAAIATVSLAGARQPADRGQLPLSSLSAKIKGEWKTFWRSARVLKAGHDRRLTGAIEWRPGREGISWAEMEVAGDGEAWRTRVILVRIDPRKVRLALANGASPGGYEGTWTVGQAPADAVVALNAGQFTGGATWGWVVHEGVEYREPQPGPLAAAVVIDTGGAVRFLTDSAVARLRREGAGTVSEAFQSYPVLVRQGSVPDAMSQPSRFLDLIHRDARLGLGRMQDGTLMIALTRFDALGDAFGSVPFGLTVPEMSGLMAALGAEDAVALDGGISAQVMVQDAEGGRKIWKGMRKVPLGLYGFILTSAEISRNAAFLSASSLSGASRRNSDGLGRLPFGHEKHPGWSPGWSRAGGSRRR